MDQSKQTIGARLGLFFAIVGPGIITAMVDNDAGGITTYSIAGASFGYSLLWALVPITIALIVVQEMASRLGVYTGKGFADLIREKWGIRVTFYLMITLLVVNFANTLAEFAGWAASLELFGISRYVSVPIGAFIVWIMVARGSYRVVEKLFLIASTVYITYIISGWVAGPDLGQAAREVLMPPIAGQPTAYWITLVGVIGTTIAPWMQFYQQSSVVEKGIKPRDYKLATIDTIVGCVLAVIVAIFITLACAATLHPAGIKIEFAEQAAKALEPLAGSYASTLFAIGLANASLFAASILPLSTAYTISEGMGWEGGVSKSRREAPEFHGIYTGMIVVAAAIILIPGVPLIPVIFGSQVMNGVLMPITTWFALQLVNDKRLIGDAVNSKRYNVLAWACVGFGGLGSAIMVSAMLFPTMFG
ncbi:MAG: Nramp family divalent metal transporter [Coriobacteriia bacterium]|nr:Nramp family divalent metal transporter [Coriobacteriia bacterium]